MDRKRASVSGGCQDKSVTDPMMAMGLPARKCVRIMKLLEEENGVDVNVVNKEARDAFGKVKETRNIELEDGSEWVFELAHPNRTMQRVVRCNPEIRHFFLETFERSPPREDSPWTVLYGFDEAFSGNQMHKSGRKLMAVSFTIEQFPRQHLATSSCWFPRNECRRENH